MNSSPASKPAITAMVIPPAVAVSPPVNTPSNPSFSTASFTPFARAYPKPVSGTVAPAAANSANGLYRPIAVRNTPMTTYDTKIRAGVSFVLSIRI